MIPSGHRLRVFLGAISSVGNDKARSRWSTIMRSSRDQFTFAHGFKSFWAGHILLIVVTVVCSDARVLHLWDKLLILSRSVGGLRWVGYSLFLLLARVETICDVMSASQRADLIRQTVVFVEFTHRWISCWHRGQIPLILLDVSWIDFRLSFDLHDLLCSCSGLSPSTPYGLSNVGTLESGSCMVNWR